MERSCDPPEITSRSILAGLDETRSNRTFDSSDSGAAQANVRRSVVAVTMRRDRPPAARSQAASLYSAQSGASACASHADRSGCTPSSVVKACPPLALQNTGSPSAESGWA